MPGTKVGIIGLGYVGLPLGVAFAEEGHEVIGLDVDPRKIEALERGESYIEDVPSERLAALGGKLRGTGDYEQLAGCDAVLICVPTPLTHSREPDLTYLLDAGRSLAGVLTKGQLVVLESTTYPGTTRERLQPILEESGLAAGRDFNLAFSPERIDPGRTDHTIRTTPKIVGGLTEPCTERAAELYATICDEIVPVSGPEAAELAKLLENIFRSVNIALVNEMAMLCDRLGIDVWEVIDAAATKPFGFMRNDPGPGMGGHCLPVDPFYLAYKAGVGDTRESPALKMIELLNELGADVVYSDPHVPALSQFDMQSVEVEDELAGCDLACIVTAHPEFDFERIVAEAPLVLDFRGATRGIKAANLLRL
jgi:UDP-N-acetyl-D-glucosamine dehydrogenase